MNPRIFFDLDGPILDVAERHHRVYADTVRELGGVPLVRGVFWEAKRQKTPELKILHQSGLIGANCESFQRLKLERIESEDYLRFDVIQPRVLSALQRLQGLHPLVLVTLRNSRPFLERQLAELGLWSFFTLVLSGRESSQEGWRIKSGLIQTNFPTVACTDWMVGDTETDILTGRHLGIRSVAVTNGIRSEALLQAMKPDLILPSAADFVGVNADF